VGPESGPGSVRVAGTRGQAAITRVLDGLLPEGSGLEEPLWRGELNHCPPPLASEGQCPQVPDVCCPE
jgi:hypothetical protein